MGYKHSKEDIMAVGQELFRKQGYHNVGINDILKESDIPKGSFYNFFDSKESFAVEVIDAYGDMSRGIIRSFLETDEPNAMKRLKAFYSNILMANEMDGYDAGCLINGISNEVGGQNDVLAEVSNRNFESWLDIIEVTVKEAQEQDDVIDTQSARDIAEFLHAGAYGAFARMKVKRDGEYLKKWYNMAFDYIIK